MHSDLTSFADERNMTLSELIESCLSSYIDRQLTVDSINELFDLYPKEIQSQILIDELKLPESMRLYTYAVTKRAGQGATE